MAKVGVLFSNLGTPQAPTPKAVGQYLGEFLMDPYVIQIPKILRALLVKGIIVNFRSKKSAKNYQKIWTEQGSPLLVETNKAAKALQAKLGADYKVVVAMRYGEPSFKQAKEQLQDCERILFFPQYPQYAESTVETSLEHLSHYFSIDKVKVIQPYYNNPHFIQAYCEFLSEQLKDKKFDHLLMSYHGLPESHILKTDPTKSHCLKHSACCDNPPADVVKTCYRAQCYQNASRIAQGLGLSRINTPLAFNHDWGVKSGLSLILNRPIQG